MKKLLILSLLLTITCLQSKAQDGHFFTEGYKLCLTGKIMDNTPNPYHRVDTVKYKGFTQKENMQVRCSAGLAVTFRTNSTDILVKSCFGDDYSSVATMPMAYRGYDLYIKKDGKWLWAGAAAPGQQHKESTITIVSDMDDSVKECLLYLPIYTEILSMKIGVDEGSFIEPMENPFRHRIAIFGSSYTHGISTSRAGMSYPMQFTRSTGIQMLSLGCSGNCTMQSYFADVLCDVNADAFVFDSFSNPDAKTIEERLFPFIEKLTAAHPGKPLIFQQTIYREKRNFNKDVEKFESAKQETAARLMKEACKKYKDVYFIQTNATSRHHESTVDGVHPDDYGYYLWEQSIEKPVLKILKKYGIK